jgi:hypothetical protein
MFMRILIAGAVALLALGVASLPAFAQSSDITSQVAKQTTRAISEAIAKRVASIEAAAEADEAGTTAWYGFGYNRISEDGVFKDLGIEFDIDIFQNTGGADWKIGDFYMGAAIGYAHTNFDLGVTAPALDITFDSNTYTASPYLAWVANKYFFVDVIGGYSMQKVDKVPVPKLHTGFYEIGLNGALTDGNLEMTAKVGYRYSVTKIGGSIDLTLKSYTIFSGGEIGYRMGKIKPYFRGWSEGIVNPDASSDRGFLSGFVGGGVKMDVTDDISLVLDGWTEIKNEITNNSQGSLTARLRF